MKPGRKPTDYIGRTYGLVTVTERIGRRLKCVCECSAIRYLHAANIITNPPKTHIHCQPGFQFDLMLDRP